jgi:AAA domain
LSAFPVAQPAPDTPSIDAQPDEGELPQWLEFMLHARKAAPYHSRSELLFSFLRAAINHRIDDRTIIRACLDPVFKGCAIYEHCKYNKGRPYVARQISRVREKTVVANSEARPLVRRTIDQFQRRELRWLWEPFIPSGMVTMFFGDGEVGKSTVALDLAARITRGRPLPRIGDDEQVYAPQGSVIVLSKEDDVPLIIRPRLEKASADISRVLTLGYDVPDDKEDFDPLDRLDTTIADIKQHLEEIGDVKAIIIDPITDFVGKIDMYRDDQVRQLLNPLGRLAAKYDLAVIYTLHLNKNEDQAVKHRGMGSVAFRNVSKSTVLFAYDPTDPTQRLMAQDKKNLTPQKRTLAYTLPVTRGFPKVQWGRDWEQIDIEDVMNGKLTKQERATSWLRKLLKDGPVAVADIQAQRATTGVSKGTMKLVKTTIGVESVKRSDGTWCWQLPEGGRRQ